MTSGWGALKVVLIVLAIALLLVAGACGILILGLSAPDIGTWVSIGVGVALFAGLAYLLGSRLGRR